QIARVLVLDAQLLDHIAFAAVKCRAGGWLVEIQRHYPIDPQLCRLRPLRRSWPPTFFFRSLGRGRFQPARLNFRPGLLSLQPGDLVTQLPIGLFELRDPIQQLRNDREQRLDHRRSLFRANLGKLNLHASQSIASSLGQLRQFSGIWRRYSWTTLESTRMVLIWPSLFRKPSSLDGGMLEGELPSASHS